MIRRLRLWSLAACLPLLLVSLSAPATHAQVLPASPVDTALPPEAPEADSEEAPDLGDIELEGLTPAPSPKICTAPFGWICGIGSCGAKCGQCSDGQCYVWSPRACDYVPICPL